jgi:hypothetical protein
MFAASQAVQVSKHLLSTGGNMSRKHFKALADALKTEKPGDNWNPNKRVQWELDVKAIANTCATFNGRFSRSRFLAACGLEDGNV